MPQREHNSSKRMTQVARAVAAGIVGLSLAWAYYLNIFTIDAEGHYVKDSERAVLLRSTVESAVNDWAGADGNVLLRMPNEGLPGPVADWFYFYGNTLLYPRRLFVTDRTDRVVRGGAEMVGHPPAPSAEWLRANHVGAAVDLLGVPLRDDNPFRVERLSPATRPADAR